MTSPDRPSLAYAVDGVSEAINQTSVNPKNSGKNERSEAYNRVLLRLSPDYRVILSRTADQYILQKCKKCGSKLVWRGVGYFLTSAALTKVSAASLPLTEGHPTLSKLAALPSFARMNRK